ncbi:growth arrest and DNA damage-inducible proteins-interacting protein 1 [Cottoperca gobio]|uniref:Large ribosomal subunit protein mL64 n=1 Tax=Cottoperca gobio TaxID=56716 RepID=A0A6J2Q8U7_COTGO|nr:growth arrest and DNA damage-inducible proteins-interacting protein 1 [Cottoperca gobio]
MAASILCGRTMLCRTFKGISCSKTLLSANSRSGLLLQTASYNPKPLKLNLREPYIPAKDSEKTPEWQKTARYDRKLFGRYGSAAGIDPASLWPSHEQLDKIIAEENEWHPPLAVLLKNIQAKEEEATKKRLEKEKLIADNMAKMPKMMADWRAQKQETKKKIREAKARRAKLLVEARECFGSTVDPRNKKFMEMVENLEKDEKKKKKLIKRQQRDERVTGSVTPPEASS